MTLVSIPRESGEGTPTPCVRSSETAFHGHACNLPRNNRRWTFARVTALTVEWIRRGAFALLSDRLTAARY